MATTDFIAAIELSSSKTVSYTHLTEELILNADEVVKSPGIPNDAPLILKLKEKGISIISEIAFLIWKI